MPRLAPQPHVGEIRMALEVFFEAIGDDDAISALSRVPGIEGGAAVRAWAAGVLWNVGRASLRDVAEALGYKDCDSAWRRRKRYCQQPESWRRLWEKAIQQFADFCATEFRTEQRHETARLLWNGFYEGMREAISPKSRQRVVLQRMHITLLRQVIGYHPRKTRVEARKLVHMLTLVDLGYVKRHRRGTRTPHKVRLLFSPTDKGRGFLERLDARESGE